jgi:hypothetical protein
VPKSATLEAEGNARASKLTVARPGRWARSLLVLATVGLAASVAFVVLRPEPLASVPEELLGRWEPVSGADERFLRIQGTTIEWSAGPDGVERRELLGVRKERHPEPTTTFALHFVGEDGIETLGFELLPDGRARVGGRRSVEWRRGLAQ